MRLLLVEDAVALVDELLPRLRAAGYAVDWVADGRDALLRANDERYDIAVLDLGLPGIGGIELLGRWRGAGADFPVLVLSARSSFAERIEGLRAGADDYLAKPFHTDELLLRLAALLRRRHGMHGGQRLAAGGLVLDEDACVVELDGQRHPLGATEFRLLRCFMLNPGRVLSRAELEEHVYDGESTRESNVIEVHVNRLRRKLGREVIETRRGLGYCFRGADGERS